MASYRNYTLSGTANLKDCWIGNTRSNWSKLGILIEWIGVHMCPKFGGQRLLSSLDIHCVIRDAHDQLRLITTTLTR